jgi:hypothetical protein
LRFLINVFYPIAVFYFVIYFLRIKEVYKLFNFTTAYLFIQIIFSFISNISVFKSGKILVDDYFNGFFGIPNAYSFSFITAIMSFFFLGNFIKYHKFKWLWLFLLFASVQIFAGAGRLVLVYIPVLMVGSLFLFKLNVKNVLFSCFLILLFVPIITFYTQNMKNFEDGISTMKEERLIDNPKIYYFTLSFEPIIEDNIAFIIGKGPGNYMSWTGQFFNPKLRNRFNNDIHGQYSTDAYQAFNNIIGFWGELGLIGFITYYYFLFYLLYLFRKFRITDKENYAVLIMTISLGVLFSTLVQVFDDAYYSLSFWLFLAIILKILLSNKNIVKTPLKSRVIYRKRYTNNIDEIQ